VLQAIHLGVVAPLQAKMLAAPAAGGDKKGQDAATRVLLKQWASLHSRRTALAVLAFGSAVCGVMLLGKGSRL